jgi:penicillin-binding protein 2
VVQVYLSAWQAGDFATMYALLSPESQASLSQSEFSNLYQHVYQQSTTHSVSPQMRGVLTDDSTATANFVVTWQTILFDSLTLDGYAMSLRFEPTRQQWVIGWRHNLILPRLELGADVILQEEKPLRGSIFDVNQVPLARHAQAVTVGVVPGQVESADEAALLATLSNLLGLTSDQIKAQMQAAQPDWFVPLGNISFDESVTHYETLEALAGVETRGFPIRGYPQGELAAHVIGTMGSIRADQVESYQRQGYRGDEPVGLTGVEAWGETHLAGKRGGRLVIVSSVRQIVAEVAQIDPTPGGHIHLSLDSEFQALAESLLGERRGSIVGQGVNGFIEVMAVSPRFAPADFSTGVSAETWNRLLNDPHRPLLNRATQGTYPPGSVFKIITLAAAMETLGYRADHQFNCTGSWAGLGGNFVKTCWLKSGHGNITLQEGLTQSCNVVFYEVARALHQADPAALPEMARQFGLGRRTGLMGLDEQAGVIPDEAWKQATYGEPFFIGDAVNMGIGQGFVLTTPLQISNMMVALANEGQFRQAQIIQRITSRNKGDQPFSEQVGPSLPLQAETLATLRQSLFDVAQSQRGTTRQIFQNLSFNVAGKTGTAETGIAEPHAWFAGYFPAEAPERVIVVMLENGGQGSSDAAPLFRYLAETYFGVEPTPLSTPTPPSPAPDASSTPQPTPTPGDA